MSCSSMIALCQISDASRKRNSPFYKLHCALLKNINYILYAVFSKTMWGRVTNLSLNVCDSVSPSQKVAKQWYTDGLVPVGLLLFR
jgi:hypothetical protein